MKRNWIINKRFIITNAYWFWLQMFFAAICVLCGFPLFAQRNAFLLACSSLCMLKDENGKEESLFYCWHRKLSCFSIYSRGLFTVARINKERESAKEKSQKCSRGFCWQSVKLQVKWKFVSENSIKASEINELARNKAIHVDTSLFSNYSGLKKIAATIVTKVSNNLFN